MILQAERSFLQQTVIFLTILFCFHSGAATAQTAAGTIAGIVRSADAVLPNMAVGVYPANDENTRLKGMRTDENGKFSFTGLAAGSYKIRFFTTGTDYISGWYKKNVAPPSVAVETFSEGTVITLTALAGADLGETKLDLGLTITGKVTQAATEPPVGIAKVYAQAYLADGTTWVRSSAATTDTGDYTISGLRPGSYKIRFHAYETAYTTAWYSSSSSPTNTVPVADQATSVATESTGINGQLSAGGSISGTVSKTDGTNTVPVAGALVVVYDYAAPHAFRGFTTASAAAGSEGTFTVAGIFVPASGTGEYIVQFYEKYVNNIQSGLTEWYDDASVISAAAAVTITEDSEGNKSKSGIDAVLDRGPISGKVSYTTGSPVSGVTVKIVVSETEEKTAVTDAKGVYSIPELSSRTLYTVQFLKNDVQLGERTSVAAGATGINLQIEPPPPSNAAKLIPIYKRLLLKKRYCYIINGVRVCR